MNLKIMTGTVGYNNKILISDETFSLGKNEKVNLTAPVMKSHKTNSLGLAHTPAISHKPHTITHNSHNYDKNCFGTFSGKWFCNMEYVSIKV